MSQEGQRIETKIGSCIVVYSIYQVDSVYFERTKVIVRNE